MNQKICDGYFKVNSYPAFRLFPSGRSKQRNKMIFSKNVDLNDIESEIEELFTSIKN